MVHWQCTMLHFLMGIYDLKHHSILQLTASTASETMNWLETHGITMISGNDPHTFVSSQIDSGHTLTLTGNARTKTFLSNQFVCQRTKY